MRVPVVHVCRLGKGVLGVCKHVHTFHTRVRTREQSVSTMCMMMASPKPVTPMGKFEASTIRKRASSCVASMPPGAAMAGGAVVVGLPMWSIDLDPMAEEEEAGVPVCWRRMVASG